MKRGRATVVWVDKVSPPNGLQMALDRLDLILEPVSPSGVDSVRRNPHSVLLPFKSADPNQFRTTLRELLKPALDTGAFFAIVAFDRADYEAAEALARERARAEISNKDAELKEVFPDTFYPTYVTDAEPDRLAQLVRLLAAHDPGQGVNHDLVVTGDEKCNDSERLLLRRAFTDFGRIELVEMPGGRASVWEVHAYKDQHPSEPFVVKSARRIMIKEEIDTMRDLVLEYVPFPSRAPPVLTRCVQGGTQALLVTLMASRAHRFDQYLSAVKSPELVITALFDGALRNWRRSSKPIRESLGHMLVVEAESAAATRKANQRAGRTQANILPDRGRLNSAYLFARGLDPSVSDPDSLWNLLGGLPPIECRCSRAHGDLGTRNLFVRWHGVDVILIDFSHVQEGQPLSRDPARLEVSVAYDVAVKELSDEDCHYLSDDLLRTLYEPPLLPPHRFPHTHDSRLETVRQIRGHVCGEGVTNEEYEVMVACHLLRHAREPENIAALPCGDKKKKQEEEKRRLRGLSYLMAARLIQHQHASYGSPTAQGTKS